MTGRDWDRDLTRCEEAYDLHESGLKFPQVAVRMGVSISRVQQMAQTWRYHLLEVEAAKELAEYRRR